MRPLSSCPLKYNLSRRLKNTCWGHVWGGGVAALHGPGAARPSPTPSPSPSATTAGAVWNRPTSICVLVHPRLSSTPVYFCSFIVSLTGRNSFRVIKAEEEEEEEEEYANKSIGLVAYIAICTIGLNTKLTCCRLKDRHL
ncbi:uncharacterized protein LOC124182012 [Neodiprion fabricii]|uniref:uncharacterized protein LOC124182012 n=1 Tax=Neodiprion fabricii TaxID=2872261 RepID=UPI001ED8FD0A|nr:uncharacterized protein LOC124182012 [Neodiprion fabricii]